jgi:hypothetical protein
MSELIKNVSKAPANLEELQAQSDLMRQYILERNESTRECIETSMKWLPPPLRGLFKPKLVREEEKNQLVNMRLSFSNDRQLFEAYCGLRLRYTQLWAEKFIHGKEMILNNELSSLDEELTARLTAYCTQKLQEIEESFEHAIYSHTERRNRLMAKALQVKEDDSYYHQLIDHIGRISTSFFTTQEALLEQFISSLHHIKHQSIDAISPQSSYF